MNDRYAPARRRPRWLLPVGVAIGGLLAIAIGAVIGLAFSGTREAAQTRATATPHASTSASVAATSSPEPTASPSPTPVAISIIPNLGIVAVTTDALTLRASANESAEAFGDLAANARLFIIGPPEETGDLRWYRVAVISGPYSGVEECELNCAPSIGWVASPTTGDDAWLEEVAVDCPSSPMTVQQLDSLAPLERLHCYGSQEITGSGIVDVCLCGIEGPIQYSPVWLALPLAPRQFRDSTTGLGFRALPEANLELPDPGTEIRFTGHFEDPAAPSCRADIEPGIPGFEALPDRAAVVLGCRATLVITDYEVLSAP